MEQDKKSLEEMKNRFAKWLSVTGKMSLYNMFSTKGVPPEILLDYLAKDKSLALRVFTKFLEEDYKMSPKDAGLCVYMLNQKGLDKYLSALFSSAADNFNNL